MTSYTITERNGCRLVTGDVPVNSFAVLCHGMPKNAVVDAHAARLLGVTFVIGAPDAIDQLTSDPGVIATARSRAEIIGEGLSDAAKEWLALGQHGTSSQTIFQRLTGLALTEKEDHPHDPADFGRCRHLLDAVPEFRTRLGEITDISPVWAALVSEWDSLCALMDSEAPNWREGKGAAYKTYRRMKEVGC